MQGNNPNQYQYRQPAYPQGGQGMPTYQLTPADVQQHQHYQQQMDAFRQQQQLGQQQQQLMPTVGNMFPVSELVPVPEELSAWAAGGHIQAILLKVKERAGVGYITSETDESGKVSILIHAPSPDSARTARLLIEIHFKEQIKFNSDMTRLNKMQENLFEAQGEVAAGQRIEFRIPVNLIGISIGKGGARIKEVTADTGVNDISIDGETGLVKIAGPSPASVQAARERMNIVEETAELTKAEAIAILRDGSYLSDLKEMSKCIIVRIPYQENLINLVGTHSSVASARLILETQKDYINKRLEVRESESTIRDQLRTFEKNTGHWSDRYSGGGRGGGSNQQRKPRNDKRNTQQDSLQKLKQSDEKTEARGGAAGAGTGNGNGNGNGRTTGTGNGSGNGRTTGTGTGNGAGTGTGTGNSKTTGTGNGNGRTTGTGTGTGNSKTTGNGNGNGRSAGTGTRDSANVSSSVPTDRVTKDMQRLSVRDSDTAAHDKSAKTKPETKKTFVPKATATATASATASRIPDDSPDVNAIAAAIAKESRNTNRKKNTQKKADASSTSSSLQQLPPPPRPRPSADKTHSTAKTQGDGEMTNSEKPPARGRKKGPPKVTQQSSTTPPSATQSTPPAVEKSVGDEKVDGALPPRRKKKGPRPNTSSGNNTSSENPSVSNTAAAKKDNHPSASSEAGKSVKQGNAASNVKRGDKKTSGGDSVAATTDA